MSAELRLCIPVCALTHTSLASSLMIYLYLKINKSKYLFSSSLLYRCALNPKYIYFIKKESLNSNLKLKYLVIYWLGFLLAFFYIFLGKFNKKSFYYFNSFFSSNKSAFFLSNGFFIMLSFYFSVIEFCLVGAVCNCFYCF